MNDLELSLWHCRHQLSLIEGQLEDIKQTDTHEFRALLARIESFTRKLENLRSRQEISRVEQELSALFQMAPVIGRETESATEPSAARETVLA